MPIHPPVPEDLEGLLKAWEQSVQEVIDLGWTCRPADFERPTRAGLNVAEQVTRVLARGRALLSEDPDRALDESLAAHRGWSGRAVVGELSDKFPGRAATLRRTLEAPETSPGVHDRHRHRLRTGAIEVWLRGQDVREALDRPGDLDSPSAAMAVEATMTALPRAVEEAGVPTQRTVVLETTGPIMGREGIRVLRGEDGSTVLERLFTGTSQDALESDSGEVTTVQLTTAALTRLAAGRLGVDEVHWSATGDEDLARRVLAAIATLSPLDPR